jgi:hypothetical protein
MTTADHSLDNLAGALKELSTPLNLIFQPGDNTHFSNELEDVAKQIAESSGGAVVFTQENQPDLPTTPGLTIQYRNRQNIHYLALPQGPEEAPFIEFIIGLSQPNGILTKSWAQKISKLDQPVELWVFIARACPHCPQTVRTILQVALANPLISVMIFDAQVFDKLAKEYKVLSAPTTIIDRGLSLTGALQLNDFVDLILSRGDNQYKSQALNSLVESGRFDQALSLLEEDGGSSVFFGVWKKSTTSSRIGLMLAVEKLLATNPNALDQILQDLFPLLQSDDAALRGDTADLLGQIGKPVAIEPLRALLQDSNPDVKEIAAEAIETIEEQN